MLILLCWDFRESKGKSISVSFPFTRQKKTMSFCIFLRTNLGRPKNLESALQDQQTVTAFFFFFCFSESELLLMFIHPFLNDIFEFFGASIEIYLKKQEQKSNKTFKVTLHYCFHRRSLKDKRITHLNRLSDMFSVNAGFFILFFYWRNFF